MVGDLEFYRWDGVLIDFLFSSMDRTVLHLKVNAYESMKNILIRFHYERNKYFASQESGSYS